MKEVKNCLREGSKFIVYFEKKEDGRLFCEKILGGLAWPTPTSMGYYCIFGELPGTKPRYKRLVLLAEDEADLPNELYENLCKDAKKLLCWNFFVDLSEPNRDFYQSFRRYVGKQDLGRIRLQQAYLSHHPGLCATQEWAKDDALSIDKDTVLGSQLSRMTKADQAESEKGRFYAVSALAHIIGEFERSRTAGGGLKDVKTAKYAW